MWAMLSGTRHLKRPKLCGGVQELMQVCTPSFEWGICVLDLGGVTVRAIMACGVLTAKVILM